MEKAQCKICKHLIYPRPKRMRRHYETHSNNGKSLTSNSDLASACAASLISNKTTSDSENETDSDVELLEKNKQPNMNETDLEVVNNSIKPSTSEVSKNLYLFTEEDAQITEEDAQITEDDVQITEDVQITSSKPATPSLTSSCSMSPLNVSSSSLASKSKNKKIQIKQN